MKKTALKKIFIFLMVAVCLTGCVPTAAIILGATAGSAIVYDKRSFNTMKQDQNARYYAQIRLNRDTLLKGHAHISISVFNHIALLVGQAETPHIRARAYKLVAQSQSRHIRIVYNEITIAPPIPGIQRAKDCWITTKIRTAMLGKGGLRSNDFKVVTENAVVYLMGVVSHRQAELVVDVPRHISGVTKVVKVFQYIH